jgi:pre-60S factor REI1
LNAASQQNEHKEQPPSLTPPPEVQLDLHTADDTNVKNADEPDETTIEERIASARSHINPTTHCLFCPATSAALDDNLTHMSTIHSFFIPDAEYLVNLSGLLSHLGEKIALEHMCIFCNDRGREFRSLEAVRKHMIDKGHCKIAYDAEKERLEISDFYDFTSSYPEEDNKHKKHREKAHTSTTTDEWEDVEDADEVDEVVDESSDVDDDSEDSGDSDSDSDQLPDNQLTYGDTLYELVLPSGARIGHRSMRRYYAQSFARPLEARQEDPKSGAALVRKLIADRNSALVPLKGGFGAFGKGTEVVKARNRGEAREAGRHVREFRDQTRREHFKTKVGFRNNYQKHFRDPLLQVSLHCFCPCHTFH